MDRPSVARIVVLNEGTNAELTVTADGAGFFTAGQLQPRPVYGHGHCQRVQQLQSNLGSS